jgi:tRNA A37 threonylcarbamoyltransferase TsaD
MASQTDLHARFDGVVPEVAARAHVRRLLPVSGGCQPSFPSAEAGGGVASLFFACQPGEGAYNHPQRFKE